MKRRPTRSTPLYTLIPYPTVLRSDAARPRVRATHAATAYREPPIGLVAVAAGIRAAGNGAAGAVPQAAGRPALAADARPGAARTGGAGDRKRTRLNSSH